MNKKQLKEKIVFHFKSSEDKPIPTMVLIEKIMCEIDEYTKPKGVGCNIDIKALENKFNTLLKETTAEILENWLIQDRVKRKMDGLNNN